MKHPDFNYEPLETDRLNLHILTLEHTELVYEHFSDEEITRFMDISPCKDFVEAEEIIQYHLDDSGCRWGLFNKTDNELIGTCGFHYIRINSDNETTAEIGFDLAKPYWGKGLMHEALQTAIRYGFERAKFDTIDATVDPSNERSLLLMSRLGFTRAVERKDNLIYFYLDKKQQKLHV